MTSKPIARLSLIFSLLLAVLALLVQSALAHTRTEIGPYVVLIGWVEEPPVVGQRNAVYFEITRDGQPVSGVEATLDAEIGYGGRSMRANLNPTEMPGAYTATFVPTVRGQYDVRLFGAIEETAVDQVLQPEEVTDGSMLYFPEPLPDSRALQQQVDELETTLTTSRTVSYIAVAAGMVGIVLGAIGLARKGGR